MNNLTILPTGKVISFGGKQEGNQHNYVPEMWGPETETWSLLAPMATPIAREYHSIAVLLRAGRVLTGGDEPATNTTAENYNPPYLDQGARPTITSAPGSAAYGSTFHVKTGGGVAKVSLIRIGAVTHANNWGQRFLWPSFTPGADGVLTVDAPANANLAPPGYYLLFVLLFVLNAAGVPSVGEYVRIGAQ